MFARTHLNVTLCVHCLSCCNRDGVCLLRGTDWIFKHNSGYCAVTSPLQGPNILPQRDIHKKHPAQQTNQPQTVWSPDTSLSVVILTAVQFPAPDPTTGTCVIPHRRQSRSAAPSSWILCHIGTSTHPSKINIHSHSCKTMQLTQCS